MPWCLICRAEYAGPDGSPCPKCGTEGDRSESPKPRPAHLAILDAPASPPAVSPVAVTEAAAPLPDSSPLIEEPASGADVVEAAPEAQEGDRPAPKKRLVSTAGPSVPVRKQANDSVPTSWMSRLEAARVSPSVVPAPPEDSRAAPADAPRSPELPPPLPRESPSVAPKERREAADGKAAVGQPAHLLIAQLEAEDRHRTTKQAERTAALFAGDRSDEIAKVTILLDDTPKKKRIPDWAVVLVLGVFVLGAIGAALFIAKKEPPPKSEVDPAIAAAAEKRRQAVASLDEGHRFAIEGKTRADDAIRAYSRALSLDPTLSGAERGLAIAFAQKDDDTSAVEHYKKYLTLAPNAPDAEDVRNIIDKYEKAKEKPPAPPPEPAKREEPPKKRRRGR